MRKKFIKKCLVLIITLALISLVFSSIGYAADKRVVDVLAENNIPKRLNCNIINITVQEAWDLLTNSSNGIQVPIDVRYTSEWNDGYIDTPYPECPIWYTLDLFKNETGLQDFIDIFAGAEVILYCKGGYRSLVGANILCNSNFTGTIYNMLGGITAWNTAGLPIRNNTPPANPLINGPSSGKAGIAYDFNFSTTDAEGDAVYYWILWGDGCPAVEWIGLYESGEIVTLNHTFTKGTYTISVQAKDFYGNESEWTEHEVNMPRNKVFNFFLLDELFERFQNLFPILRLLIGY
jgi:rhodanese-related sulfurtransferase